MEKYKSGHDAKRRARKIGEWKADIMESERRKVAYYEEKKQFNESIEGLRNKEYRRILQSADKISVLADSKLVETADQVAVQLYNFIVEALGAGKSLKKQTLGEHSEISFKEINSVFEAYIPAIKELKSLSEIKSVDKKSGSSKYNAYDSLLNKLVDFDVRFALFSDLTSISRLATHDKMNEGKMFPSTLENLSEYKSKLEQNPNASFVNEFTVENLDEFKCEANRNCLNQIKSARRESIELNKQSANQLAKEIYEFIESEVERNWGRNYSETELCSIIKHFSMAISKLEGLGKAIGEEEYLQLPSKLVEDLVALDTRFVIIATKDYLTNNKVRVQDLSEEAQALLVSRVSEFKLLEDKKFKTKHERNSTQESHEGISID